MSNMAESEYPIQINVRLLQWCVMRSTDLSLLIVISYIAVAFAVILAVPVAAQPSSSNNYEIREDSLGPGGGSSESDNYGVDDSVGGSAGFGVGEANSPNGETQTQTGSGGTTPNEPALGVALTSGTINLGQLSTSLTRTGNATFTVSNYVSSGYIVQLVGDAPSNGTHTLSSPASPTSSAAGTEQFGINLAANTAPTTFGAAPVQLPDSTFGFGEVSPDYSTPNQYMYASGDVIALAPRSSGETQFTLSVIANINNNTPGGTYSSQQSLVVTGTY